MDYRIDSLEDLLVETEADRIPAANAVRLLRMYLGLKRTDFCEKFGIPYRTVQDWEAGKRIMPPYVLRLMIYKVKYDELMEKQ